MPFFEQETVKREGDGEIGAGPYRQVEICLSCEGGGSRIHHHETGPGLLGLADERHEVNP
jgi:hypothetical protein